VEHTTPNEDAGVVPALYPACVSSQCLLDLRRVYAGTGEEVSCFADNDACVDWVNDPQRSLHYKCYYGSYAVALDECRVYEPTFRPTSAPPRPATEPVYRAPSVPLPEPGVTPPAVTEGNPNCAGIGLLDIVTGMVIVKALKCAFVPAPGELEASTAKVSVDWCTTAPGALSCAIGDVLGPWTHLGDGDTSDCHGLAMSVPDTLHHTDSDAFYPFAACGPPLTTISDLWLGIATGAIYIGALLAGARVLGKTIGADDGAGVT
jgi:hypothetical protein